MPRRRAERSIWDRYQRTAFTSFGEAASKYLKEFDGKDKRRQAFALESVIPYIGDTPIIDVNDGALEDFKEDRKSGRGLFDKPAMAGTINKELTTVATVLNRACRDWDWIPRVPRIRHVKGPSRIAYPLTWAEQDALFSQFSNGWDKGVLPFAVNTGVRQAELFGLRWSDMVPIPELDTFVFVLSDTKNGTDRAVICNSIAREAVNRMRGNGSKYVFPSNHHGFKGQKVRSSGKLFRRAWLKAGLPSDSRIRKGIHNLRHTFGHRLRAVGVPEEDRAALMGHNNASLTSHYALPDLERLSEMAERVTEKKDTVVLRAVQSAV